ncbi:MAG: helix-turn-helix domain-containing protein [Acidimicrobiales bacterium]
MSDGTREILIAAALSLFAEEGIDAPSLRAINRAAGQRNTNALQYHFGDRDGLLRQALEDRGAVVDASRSALLNELEPDASVRDLAVALVHPLADQLGNVGRDYLLVADEVLARPMRFGALYPLVVERPSWSTGPPVSNPTCRRGRSGDRSTGGSLPSASFTANWPTGPATTGVGQVSRLFSSHLVDLTAAMVVAPVSPETEALIRR